MMPPLTTTDEDVDVAAGTIAEAIALFREDDIDASAALTSVSGRR
jgi:hypothetical protein